LGVKERPATRAPWARAMWGAEKTKEHVGRARKEESYKRDPGGKKKEKNVPEVTRGGPWATGTRGGKRELGENQMA